MASIQKSKHRRDADPVNAANPIYTAEKTKFAQAQVMPMVSPLTARKSAAVGVILWLLAA
tara:strand:- start:155 stop:334 length:180 start_codon:yes stop_codon:yes gene_type:complete